MLKFILVYVFAYILQIEADSMLGPGIWSFISVSECDTKIENPVVTYEFNKHKVNRTHDGISGDTKTTEDIDETFGGLVEICKYVDGGCKPYQVLTDENVVNMLKQYAKEENIVHALTLAKVDPPDFPIKKGEYHVDDYIINFCLLPRDAIYGQFEVVAYLMKGTEKVACIKVAAEFNELEEENFCDD